MNRKAALFESILDESIPDNFASLIGINRADSLGECELVDYKETLSYSKWSLAKTVKQIISFHNTYGGYLVYGVKETTRDTCYETCGNDVSVDLVRLRSAIDRYTGVNIRLSVRELDVPTEDKTHRVSVLAIPQRQQKNPVYFIKEMNDQRNNLIFRKNQTVMRDGDRCRTAMNGDDFEVLFSSRSYPPEGLLRPAGKEHVIEHNLPDKNLICASFIGREEIISELWSWLANDFEYIKVLAGEGGRGKTSIAYEFAAQLVKSATSDFEMLLWLTAKERQFNASQDEFVNLPEVHFHSTETLLRRIIEELGVEDDIEGESLPALKRTVIDTLKVFPSIVVVDNLDTMEIEEQRTLVEAVRQIADRSRARVLITTRSNVSMPIEQCVEIPGLQDIDYREFVSQTCACYRIPVPRSGLVSQMHEVSDGSPLFTQSILRLMRLGQSPQAALKEWRGVEGLAVRSAALQREIEQLGPESRRVLYALALIRSASYQELKQVTSYGDSILRGSVDQLSSLFLIHAPTIIESERRFEIPESTARLIVDLKDQLVTRPSEINARVSGTYRKTSQAKSEVGKAIRQSLALINAGDIDKAIATVEALLKKPKFSNNADLILMKGRALLMGDDKDAARVELKRAYDNGGRKNLLFELWANAERASGHFQGMYDVCDLSLERGDHVDDSWVYRRAEASVGLVSHERELDLKLIHLRRAADDLGSLIRRAVGSRRGRLVSDSADLHDLIWDLCREEKNWGRGYLEMLDCIDRGDTRGFVFHRAIDCVEHQITHAHRIRAEADVVAIERRLSALRKRVIARNEEIGISDTTRAEQRISDLLGQLHKKDGRSAAGMTGGVVRTDAVGN